MTMKNILKQLVALTAMIMLALPVQAESVRGFKMVKTTAEFDDVFINVQDAIINKGYNIDYVGHLNQMLKRTSKTVGSVTEEGSPSPYKHAKFMQFCSATLTHEAISANPQNVAICPYVIFVYETKADPGVIHVGFRRPISGPSKRTRQAFAKIEAMLTDIVNQAIK
jgi:hypothetical protein